MWCGVCAGQSLAARVRARAVMALRAPRTTRAPSTVRAPRTTRAPCQSLSAHIVYYCNISTIISMYIRTQRADHAISRGVTLE